VLGQWFGRVASEAKSVDWLAVCALSTVSGTAAESEWVPVRSLLSSPAWVDYQQWSVVRTLSGGGTPTAGGPFGAMTWLDDVLRWVRAVLGLSVDIPSESVIPLRVTAHEVVLELGTPAGRVFFKGLSAGRASEAYLTMAMSHLVPEAFARTRAVELRNDGTIWWLMDACPGTPLSRDANPALLSRIVEDCAQVQDRVSHASLSVRQFLPSMDLRGTAEWAVQFLADVADDPALPDISAAIIDACERVRVADVLQSWVPADLDVNNVLIAPNSTCFIDLDDSWYGPAPLAIARLCRRLPSALRAGTIDLVAHLRRVYEGSWISGVPAHGDWPAFDMVSTVIECHSAWQRVILAVERGDIHGILDVAKARLARQLGDAARRRG
jgi:hypothetical protein